MIRNEQFDYLEAATEKLLGWSRENAIPLHRIEFVVPFVDTNFGISAWFFFESDEQLHRSESTGWRERLSTRFTEELAELGYSASWLPSVSFVWDSHETVVRDCEGSYFYRLR